VEKPRHALDDDSTIDGLQSRVTQSCRCNGTLIACSDVHNALITLLT